MVAETQENAIPLGDYLSLDVAQFPEVKRYVLTALIGEGAMGKVFQGYDLKLDREVAIKVITADEGDEVSEGLAKRFYREAKVAAALNHQNIIKLMDYSGAEMPQQYLVMERLHGHDLQHYLDLAPLPEPIACAVAHEVAEALVHAHGMQLVHRDVKPDNIFVEPSGRVVLIDFGLAKGLATSGDRKTFAASKTRLMGTPLFSSPEQLLGDAELSIRSDLYSLGALMYFAVSQVTPFQGNSIIELINAIRTKQPLPLSQLVDVSPAYEKLCMHLLQRAPAERPASAQAVADELKRLLGKHRVLSQSGAIKAWLSDKPVELREVTNIVEITHAAAVKRRAALVDSSPLIDSGERTRVTPVTAQDKTTIATVQAKNDQTRVVTAPAAAQTSGGSKRPAARPPFVLIGAVAFAVALLGSAATIAVLRGRRPATPPPQAAELPPLVARPPAEPPANTIPPPQPVEAAAVGDTEVFVIVRPWGKVWIDGVLQGTTPTFRKTKLIAGAHELRVQHPSLGERKLSVSLNGEPERELEVDLTQPAPQ